ncbi:MULTISPECIES: very short patch repair endonuclease [unclassified Bradyrhizobium]|uniref:very short patch repair endonuclease n=1 Tax=unclassified Bradyrhizobium TaxID=2631580 RepID=UPI0028E7A62B|nr:MULTISPECIES: very short patch repair endonuclease [unclassified Bradyrhizobium]
MTVTRRTASPHPPRPLKDRAQVRSHIMRQVKSQNTGPELRVRKIAHGLGYRYRLSRRDLPGSPDLVFVKRRAAIFVHGCFWHGHENCRYGRPPRSNSSYWGPKLAKNKERDARVLQELSDLGWRTLVLWQCELEDERQIKRTLRKFLGRVGGQ